jgi:hypothetical protein
VSSVPNGQAITHRQIPVIRASKLPSLAGTGSIDLNMLGFLIVGMFATCGSSGAGC